ncbi:MAG: endonuclease [Bacilli bacterium]
MKNKPIKLLTLLSLLITVSFSLNDYSFNKALAVNLPNAISLNDNTETEVRNYYSYLSSLSSEERRGENLLKNLKTILSQDNVFYDYSDIGYIYKITDRNWTASPISEFDSAYGTYSASENKIYNYTYSENPYIFHHYVNKEYQDENPIKYKEDGASRVSFDKEHIWAKSHGFGLEGDEVIKGAGTDLHHLVAANPNVNSSAHNAYSYGYVRTNAYNPTDDFLKDNKRGTPFNTHSEDESIIVFEPQDSDKGDIARALCYMVARYNYIGQEDYTPTKAEPNLLLVDYVVATGFDCSTSTSPAPYGILTDILSWNKFDEVDTYEIHRNNLIYNNYQHNRNPFIDFPQWIDLIWNIDGTYYEGECYANPETDTLNVGNEYVPPIYNDDTNEFSILDFINENKLLLSIIVIALAIIVIVIIVVLINKGHAKVKVNKNGKIKLTINNKTKPKTKGKTTSKKTKHKK